MCVCGKRRQVVGGLRLTVDEGWPISRPNASDPTSWGEWLLRYQTHLGPIKKRVKSMEIVWATLAPGCWFWQQLPAMRFCCIAWVLTHQKSIYSRHLLSFTSIVLDWFEIHKYFFWCEESLAWLLGWLPELSNLKKGIVNCNLQIAFHLQTRHRYISCFGKVSLPHHTVELSCLHYFIVVLLSKNYEQRKIPCCDHLYWR